MMGCENPGRGLMPPGYLLLALLLMAATDWLAPGTQLVSGTSRLLGILPLSIGLLLNLAADRAMKQVKTPVSPYARTTTLITWGVFRVSRNPMYLGSICALFGIWLLLGSLTPLFFPILFTLIMQSLFIRPEEEKLALEFSETWLSYTKQTRRWI